MEEARSAKRRKTNVDRDSQGLEIVQNCLTKKAMKSWQILTLLLLLQSMLQNGLSLCRDDLHSLSIFLRSLLLNILKFQLLNNAANIIAQVIERSDRTVREWRKVFINEGSFPDSLQGKYQREGVLWQNKKLNRLATIYARENDCVKGKSNLTNSMFCQWVNEVLLPNQVLDPGYPRNVSIETSHKWLHHLGFSMKEHKKGTYVDGHESSDVTEYRKRFLRKMVAVGFLNKDNALLPRAYRLILIHLQLTRSRKPLLSFIMNQHSSLMMTSGIIGELRIYTSLVLKAVELE